MSSRIRSVARIRRLLLVAQWGLDELLWSRQTLPMAALALSPVAVALMYRFLLALDWAVPTSGFGLFSAVVAALGIPFVVPMLALFYASGVVTDDIETGAMRYYLTRPIERSSLIAGKMLASFLIALLLFIPPLVASYYVILAPAGWRELGARFPALARDVFAAVLGLAAYNGLFALAGTFLRRPLIVGLLFVFGWQAAATFVPGVARYFTVSHYLLSLLPHETLRGAVAGLFGQRSSAVEAVLALGMLAVASHGAAILLFSRKEV